MSKLLLVDGNSIMNRAFYGIMGSKMLTTKDGKYTNAIYGFLAILFKILEDIKPEYIGVAFDLKGPTKRHEIYEGYKANRKGMPEELAEQMPIIKEILKAMNIDIIEKQGYEGDDILGTLAKYGEKQGLEVTILSGDRDTFQLASDNITIRIPRTKAGKTETEDYNREKILEEYGLEPEQLIEVKALQGDTSDNIPGVPGIGPKTAITLIQKYHTVKELYEKIESGEDDLKGKQKENIVNNKKSAEISRTLGEIDTQVPIEETLETLKTEEWDKPKVLEIFEELRFNRYIERFNLEDRLTHLEGFMLGITKLAQKGKVKDIPDFTSNYTGHKFKGEREVDAGILIERLYFLQQDMEIASERYEACLHQMLEGLGLTGETTLEQAYKLYLKGEKTCFKDFLEEKGHILENYLVNYIYERCIPLDGATPIESYEWLLLYYTLIKVHLVGMGLATKGSRKTIKDEEAVQLIQSFTKTYDHNDGYLSYFVD